MRHRPRLLFLAVTAVALGASGCGAAEADMTPAPAAQATPTSTPTPAPTPSNTPTARTAAKKRGATVSVRTTRFGRILTDGRGFALYLFTKDGRGPSKCYGACAKAWPPLYSSAAPKASRGAMAGKLGTVRRRNGRKQVTYDGKPLYYYVGDDAPGVVLCQDVFEFGGTWLVVAPSGKAIQ